MRYFEQPPPSGNGLCSYPPCPCDEVTIPRGQGYLYITEECVEFRRDALSLDDAATKLKEMGDRTDSMIIPGSGVASPILVCEEGAKLLELDLEIATADARRWWETGEVPLRPTPRKKPSPAAVAGSRCLTGHTERVMGVAISQNGTQRALLRLGQHRAPVERPDRKRTLPFYRACGIRRRRGLRS